MMTPTSMMSSPWLSSYRDFKPRLEAGVLRLALPSCDWRIEQVEDLDRLLDHLATPCEIRVLVLELNAPSKPEPQAHNWTAALQSDPVRVHRALQCLHRWRTLQLKVLPLALLAVVQGRCSDAALALIEGSDVALATPESVFTIDDGWVDLLSRVEPPWSGWAVPPHASPLHPLRQQSLNAWQAQAQAWITFALPMDELLLRGQALIDSWMDKDPLALQFTKETLAHAGSMSWDASVNYTAAKFAEIKALQAATGGSTRANAIAGFLAGQSKPGLKG
jgi:enoyl-CoA hydratase/carnithine racemase